MVTRKKLSIEYTEKEVKRESKSFFTKNQLNNKVVSDGKIEDRKL